VVIRALFPVITVVAPVKAALGIYMKYFLFTLKTAYWLAVAYLPLALEEELIEFTLWAIKNPGAECSKFCVPLITNIMLLSWASRILLWPLAAWHLGGAWLWRRYHSRHTVVPVIEAKDA